jgi:hypothetical protein
MSAAGMVSFTVLIAGKGGRTLRPLWALPFGSANGGLPLWASPNDWAQVQAKIQQL